MVVGALVMYDSSVSLGSLVVDALIVVGALVVVGALLVVGVDL